MINSDSKGFTLIELLVVVAILGLLATIVAVSLTGARSRARDGRRASDLRQIQLALELYYSAHRQYPTAQPYQALIDGGYLNMSGAPKDPGTGNKYCYAYGHDDGLSNPVQYYHLGAVLENSKSDLLVEDKDSPGSTTWSGNTCRGTCEWRAGVDASGDTDCDWANDASAGKKDNFKGPDTTSFPTYDRAVLPQTN